MCMQFGFFSLLWNGGSHLIWFWDIHLAYGTSLRSSEHTSGLNMHLYQVNGVYKCWLVGLFCWVSTSACTWDADLACFGMRVRRTCLLSSFLIQMLYFVAVLESPRLPKTVPGACWGFPCVLCFTFSDELCGRVWKSILPYTPILSFFLPKLIWG